MKRFHDLDDLCGRGEIEAMVSNPVGVVRAWPYLRDFPPPVLRLRMGPMWSRLSVIEWLFRTGRITFTQGRDLLRPPPGAGPVVVQTTRARPVRGPRRRYTGPRPDSSSTADATSDATSAHTTPGPPGADPTSLARSRAR
jgi:hypothetical protein